MTEIDITRQLKLLEARHLELTLQRRRTTPVPLHWLVGAFVYGVLTVIAFKLASVWSAGPTASMRSPTAQEVLDSIQPMHVSLLQSWPGVVGGLVALAAMYLVVRLRFADLARIDRDAIFACCSVAFALAIPVGLFFMWEPALPAIQTVFDWMRNR